MSDFQNSDSRLVELKKLGELKEAGLLSDEEFEAEKSRILNATTEAINNESVVGERYQAGSHKTKSQKEWEKFDTSSLLPLLKRAGKGYLVVVIAVALLSALFSAQIIPLVVCLVLLEIVFAIVSKKTGKRIGLTPVLRSWLLRNKEQ
jgi:hypothetical protein